MAFMQETATAWSTTRQMRPYSEVYTCSYKNMSKKLSGTEPLLHTQMVSYSRQLPLYSDNIINHKGPIANKISISSRGIKQSWKVNRGNRMNHNSRQLHLLQHQQGAQNTRSWLINDWSRRIKELISARRWLTALAAAWSSSLEMAGSPHRMSAGPTGMERDFCSELCWDTGALMGLGFNGVLHVEDSDWEIHPHSFPMFLLKSVLKCCSLWVNFLR